MKSRKFNPEVFAALAVIVCSLGLLGVLAWVLGGFSTKDKKPDYQETLKTIRQEQSTDRKKK